MQQELPLPPLRSSDVDPTCCLVQAPRCAAQVQVHAISHLAEETTLLTGRSSEALSERRMQLGAMAVAFGTWYLNRSPPPQGLCCCLFSEHVNGR